VSNKHVRLLTAVVVLCLSRGVRGQVQESDSVRGEVHLDPPGIARHTVRLSDFRNNRAFESDVGGDGRFEFRHVPYGEYNLAVLEGNGRPIHEELISLRGQTQPILVEVPRRENLRPPAGSVPVSRLLHPPAKKAVQAFLAAQKLAGAGEHEKAAAQLETAVRLSPDYPDAWIDLAAQHIFLRRFEQALEELTRAGEIAHPTPIILGDMAYAQYALHRYSEATSSARQALTMDPSFAPAHYMLGWFLTSDRRTLAEGLQHLEIAARTMPAAQAMLERARRELP
jgi:tetratricopeptide (TPR) repeat protein